MKIYSDTEGIPRIMSEFIEHSVQNINNNNKQFQYLKIHTVEYKNVKM